jgi:Flp pilus assembly pilin Flp
MKTARLNPARLRMRARGASMVEYALLLVAILLLAAGAYKALGPKVGQAAANAGGQL